MDWDLDVAPHINGCDAWFEQLLWWNWRHCCDAHDISYSLGGDWWHRIGADWSLFACVSAVLLPMGAVMLAGTLLFGWLFFRHRSLGWRSVTDVLTGTEKRSGFMTASLRLTRFIGGHEGKVLRAYRDPTGTITIGYGFTWGSGVFRQWWNSRRGRKLQMGDTMTEQEAMDVLRLLIEQEYMPPVVRKFPTHSTNVQEGATSTVYNAGPGALSWKWAQAIARGAVREGADLLRTTATTSKGKKLPGLVRRRAEEADIIAHNRWPDWVMTSAETVVQTRTSQEDIRQAQQWLATLGYEPGPADGIAGNRTINATRRFQKDHGQLVVDGIVGPATLAALQRTIDLRNKAGAGAAVGGGTAAAGVAEDATGVGDAVPSPLPGDQDLGWLGDFLFWGGIVGTFLFLLWLAWRYRDEINAVLRRL